MNLYDQLQKATSEEDVKDAYIKALGLRGVHKGIVDIQTKEIWFEAKETPHSTYKMFTQLFHYVQEALNGGEEVPPFLAVVDKEKGAIMKSSLVTPFLKKKTIKWGKSASSYTQDALDQVSAHIGAHVVSFRIKTHEEEFIRTVKESIASGEIIRREITPDNLKQVFDKWVEMIGREISGVSDDDYALLFYADIMHDGTVSTHQNLPAELLHKNEAPVFSLNGKIYELGNKEGYRQFWTIYHKPPKEEFRNYLLERRDSLIPLNERSFKGAYFTPLSVVDKAYNLLADVLGKNWQTKYIVWDMCCGVGNLEVKHSNHRNIFMSTLDEADVDVMKATKTCVAAQRFQYDYLNDDINDKGEIDYSLTDKIPEALRIAIREGKKILVLINPPYAEATNFENIAEGTNAKNKGGVAKTKYASTAMSGFGKASNELFTQFVARVSKEIPTATLAMFSTLKYVNAPNFSDFRNVWNATYLGGFVVHNKAFDGLTGNFPIGFLVWQTNNLPDAEKNIWDSISVNVFDRDVKEIGEKKYYCLPKETYLNVWLERPRANKVAVIPLVNSLTPASTTPRVKTWSDGAIAYMYCGVNDLQHAEQQTVIYSSVYQGGNGFYITPFNFDKAFITFVARRLIRPTWLNDRDQFLQPNRDLPKEFINDSLVWMLFNRCNRTASANGIRWNSKDWTIVNHFIPFSENEVGAPERFESDFMVKYLSGKTFSPESKIVMDTGKALWKAYFSKVDSHSVREEYKLNRSDVGWYQVRKALERRIQDDDNCSVSFKQFEDAYDSLTSKLQPQVYELGFLKA